MIPTLPYRVAFVCPTIDVEGAVGDALCELVVQWLSLAIVQDDKLAVISPARFFATADGTRLTYQWCEMEDGLGERFMHARVDELLWLAIDTKSRACRLLGQRFMRAVEAHGEMDGPFSELAATLLQAWSQSRKFSTVVDSGARIELKDLQGAVPRLQAVVAAINAKKIDEALKLAGDAHSLRGTVLGAAARLADGLPGERLREASAPRRPVRALQGDALADAYLRWSLAPDDPAVMLELASALFGAMRFAEAQRMADRASRILPESGAAHALSVRALLAQGRAGEAYAEALERTALMQEALMQEADIGDKHAEVLQLKKESRRLRQATQEARTQAGWGRAQTAAVNAFYRGDVGALALDTAAPPIMRAKALLLLDRAESARLLLAAAATKPCEWLCLCEAWAATGRGPQALWLLQAALFAAPQERLECEGGRILRLLAGLPLQVFEEAIAHAPSPVLRAALARDAADAHPEAGKSEIVKAALSVGEIVPYDPQWLEPLREALGEERSGRLDKMFVATIDETDPSAALGAGDRMLAQWHAISERFASEIGIANPDNPDLAPTIAYLSAQALAHYVSAASHGCNPVSIAYRQIAVEALAAARVIMLDADEAVLLLQALEPVLLAAPQAMADMWLARCEHAFDLELVLGSHRDAFCAEMPCIRTFFLGDEHLGALHRQAKAKEDHLRLALHTGCAAFYREAGDSFMATLVQAPLALIATHFPTAAAATDAFDPGARPDTLRAQAFCALSESELARAQVIAAKAIAYEADNWSAWLALLVATHYRRPGLGNDLPADGLSFARSVLELTVGTTGVAAGRLRLYASRIVESHAFSLDRLPPVE